MDPASATAQARISLQANAAAKGAQIHDAYGPELGWNELQRILENRAFVRYPTEIVFDAEALLPGELAYPTPKGERPEDGFRMCVHPCLTGRSQQIVWVVLYQLVLVNYGPFAGPEDAEAFGASALGISTDDYYRRLCELTDSMPL